MIDRHRIYLYRKKIFSKFLRRFFLILKAEFRLFGNPSLVDNSYGRKIQGADIATSTLPKNECLVSKHRRPAVFLFLTRKEETNFSQHSQEQSKRLQLLIRERAPEERTTGRSKNEDKTQFKSLFFLRQYYALVTSLSVAITQANCF